MYSHVQKGIRRIDAQMGRIGILSTCCRIDRCIDAYTRLLDILLRAHLALWVGGSGAARGLGRRQLDRCEQYFSLRARLIASLTSDAFRDLQPPAIQMLDDEVDWLLNFNCSIDKRSADVDSRLIAGHMQLLCALLRRLPDRKLRIGSRLLRPIVLEFLFPAAARMLLDVKLAPQRSTIVAKCRLANGRAAAFRLLRELAFECPENFAAITQLLTTLHHDTSHEHAQQWDVSDECMYHLVYVCSICHWSIQRWMLDMLD